MREEAHFDNKCQNCHKLSGGFGSNVDSECRGSVPVDQPFFFRFKQSHNDPFSINGYRSDPRKG